MNEVTLHNVPLMDLSKRIAAFKALIDSNNFEMFVMGTFRDSEGELAFLSSRFYHVEYRHVIRIYFTIQVDGFYTKLTPVDETIHSVKFVQGQ